MRLVNEEISVLACRRHDGLKAIEKEIESVNRKLLKYYLAFENGTITDEDAAPRIRELRAEQSRLQRARDEVISEPEDMQSNKLNAEMVLNYVQDLKALLSNGTFMEQKTFLRSFIKRLDYEPGSVTIHYTVPLPDNKHANAKVEVLPFEQSGGPFVIVTRH